MTKMFHQYLFYTDGLSVTRECIR